MARGSVAEPCLIGLRSGTARRAHVGALPRPSEFNFRSARKVTTSRLARFGWPCCCVTVKLWGCVDEAYHGKG